jgi:hypothetical protein
MLGVLVFDTLPRLVIGIGISFVLLLYRASRPNIATLARTPEGHWQDAERFADSRPEPGVVVLRVEVGCSSPTPTPSANGCSRSPRPPRSAASSSTARACRSLT